MLDLYSIHKTLEKRKQSASQSVHPPSRRIRQASDVNFRFKLTTNESTSRASIQLQDSISIESALQTTREGVPSKIWWQKALDFRIVSFANHPFLLRTQVTWMIRESSLTVIR